MQYTPVITRSQIDLGVDCAACLDTMCILDWMCSRLILFAQHRGGQQADIELTIKLTGE